MRKIYQSSPDVPQPIANRAIDLIERHLVTAGVRRAEELPEENKVRLYRDLQVFFREELPPLVHGKEGEEYEWSNRGIKGFIGGVFRYLWRMLNPENDG